MHPRPGVCSFLAIFRVFGSEIPKYPLGTWNLARQTWSSVPSAVPNVTLIHESCRPAGRKRLFLYIFWGAVFPQILTQQRQISHSLLQLAHTHIVLVAVWKMNFGLLVAPLNFIHHSYLWHCLTKSVSDAPCVSVYLPLLSWNTWRNQHCVYVQLVQTKSSELTGSTPNCSMSFAFFLSV